MTVFIENEIDCEFPFSCRQVAEDVMCTVLEQENCPYDAEVSIVLTGENEIRETNRMFRNIDSVTDVLSFPVIDFESPADYTIIKESAGEYINPDSDLLMLGDIMICVPRMLLQAEEYGHGTKREYAFLIAHSLLHLLGYDHMEAEDAAVMEQKQEQVLKQLNITR
ncbi:rRNA maturation RNase YbeY [Ruminococcus sp. OA3]|uniref:rRNA maturation RNase YbeY n=1 Tax=Ruminococcus sp. OA3 TaxID=2914164 RepID=UPI001F065F62|nr:rRNA maturation RNase YbeY [Ruminococcus sp. OA3]MCH1983334.1 rRNA maturation RNase YbeY [Ruminococcus sp. OA3]